MLPILCLFHYTVALIYIFLYFKVKIPKILLPAKEFSAFNVARQLEKLPTPGLSEWLNSICGAAPVD